MTPYRSQISRMIGQYSGGGTTLPVESWIGSAMKAATVSGPSYSMTDSSTGRTRRRTPGR